MFVPVSIRLGAGGEAGALYERSIELTARQFAALEHEAGDMRVPLTQIGENLRLSVSAEFGSEGATGATGRWTVLSDNPAGHGYRSWKAKHGPGVPILVGLKRAGPKGQRPQTYKISGQMRRQLLDPLATHVTPTRLLYAPTSDIAGFHELGTDRMPARPPVDVTLAFLHGVDRAFVTWLAGLVKRLGF